MGKYFGTDGVRGVAGADLTCEMAMLIGRGAAAELPSSTGHKPRIHIGKDTRQSGEMLEAALTAGLCSVGADVESLGVVPTPAVAYLVRKYNADAGVVISASHNPMEFNGIKIFAGTGYKLPDEVENEIEAYIDNQCAGLTLANGEKLPTLAAYLEQGATDASMKLICEITTHSSAASNTRAVNAVVAAVKAKSMETRVDYIAFDYEVCKQLRAAMPAAGVQ